MNIENKEQIVQWILQLKIRYSPIIDCCGVCGGGFNSGMVIVGCGHICGNCYEKAEQDCEHLIDILHRNNLLKTEDQ